MALRFGHHSHVAARGDSRQCVDLQDKEFSLGRQPEINTRIIPATGDLEGGACQTLDLIGDALWQPRRTLVAKEMVEIIFVERGINWN